MPLRDWTRVPGCVYHDFHTGFLVAIRRVLNSGVLPEGYYALADQSMRTMGPDVLTLGPSPAPPTPTPGATGRGTRLAVAEPPPRVRVTARTAPRPFGFRQKRVAIRHKSDDRGVALIELVSPGNKAARYPFQTFVRKAVRAIERRIHILIVDPFPPGKRDPNGVHGAIRDALGGDPYTQPPDKRLTVAAYEADPAGPVCYVEPLAPGDPLPDAPLFLEPGYYVPVPLERAYGIAFEDVLPPSRAQLEAVTG
jgi:hypothetical protein